MKKQYLTLLLSLFISITSIVAVNKHNKSYQGFSVTNNKFFVKITCLNEKVIHIEAYPFTIGSPKKSLVIDDTQFVFSSYNIVEKDNIISLSTSKLKVDYDVANNKVTFSDIVSGKKILDEKKREFLPIEVLGEKAWSVKQTFALSNNEAIYGLGQFQEGIMNYRGQTANLVHANREIANPVLMSTNNYMIFWDNYSKTIFTDNEHGASFWSEVADGINYYFVYGDNMNDAMAGFRKLTGEVPMFPKSAFGFWMSKERYRSFDELTNVVAEHRKRGIPLDNIVQDWQYWGKGEEKEHDYWNSMEFNPQQGFDKPKEYIDSLHKEYNVKLTLSVWPCVGPKTKIYQSMDSAGVLFDEPTWAGYKVIDIYNPKAQDIYWRYLYNGLYTKGVDSWWMDATEPSFKDGLYQDKQEEKTKSAGMTYYGSFHRYLNTYSLILSKMMYENLRKQSNKRVSILTRSGFAGQQKYATSTWSGDIYASWDVFRKQIAAGLNLCMTGIPYWTTDIGGFRVISQEKTGSNASGEIGNYVDSKKMRNDGGYKLGLKDPAYLELYTRWFQYGVFNPMFRAHGTEIPREVWQFGEPGTPYYDAQIEMINLRYSLLSYIYSNAWAVTSQGATMMRGLAIDFTSDQTVYNNANGYMFGDALLVYPVVRPMFYDRDGKIENPNTSVKVYLPKHDGGYWFDFNSDKCYKAGEDVAYNAPLNVIPVFVKAGSIIPRNKPVQYAGADSGKEMDIVIYAGKDASFSLYEDDNETYNYEKGEYTITSLKWDNKNEKFSISETLGNLPNKLKERTFNVTIITPNANGTTVKRSEKIIYRM